MPKTLTELYYALTQTLLLRYLCGHPVHKKIRHIQSFEKHLPQEVYKQLLEISEIAYNGICKDWGGSVQLIYSHLPPTFETLGLMQSVSQMYVTQGVNVSHNFLHLTVQEFLAALHISNMTPEKQLEHFKRHKEGRFRVVLRFLSGLTKLLNISLEHRRALLEKPRSHPTPKQRLASMNPHNVSAQDTSYTQMKPDLSVSLHPLNWLFETQSSDVIKAWLQAKTIEFKFPRQMSPLEYYSAGYCIAHSSARWVLTIQEHKEETDWKMFCDGITSTKEVDFKIGLKVLVYMATEKTGTLLTNLGPHLQELHLKLRDGSIVLEKLSAVQVLHLELNCKETFDLTPSLLPQSLESLTIEAGSGSNVLGLKSCAAIRKFSTSSFEYLKFISGKGELQIGTKCMESITRAMADSTSLQLRSLEVNCACTFTATAVEWLTTFITNSKQLQNLHIGPQCTLEQEGIESLVKALANNESLPLKNLTLPTLEISDTAADSLALLIPKYTTIEFVTREITRTAYFVSGLRCGITLITASSEREKLRICVEDIQWITKVIVCSTSLSLQSLHIEGFMQAAESITKALANSDSLALKRLTLPTLDISDTAADSLALFIQKCATLEFVCWERSEVTLITACGLREMANAEHHYSWLPPAATEGWHHCVLNCIEDGIDFDCIWQHHSFHGTFTCHNIGDEGACSFGASLIKTSTVTRLSFNSNHAHPGLTKVLHHGRHHLTNKISDAGVTALALALHHNSTLHKLDLSNNSIGDAGATALAQGFHHESGLRGLNLSGNDAIHKEGTCELVRALTTCSEVWRWRVCGGLVLPKRCEDFATQCPEYVKVKTRVTFV